MNRVLPHLPGNPILNRIARGLVASVLSVTTLGALATRAGTGDLDDKRNQLDSQLEAQKSMVEGVSKKLTDAVNAFEAVKTELATAETVLPGVETKLTAARELDIQRVSELVAAETKAKKVRADMAAAKVVYDSVDAHTFEEITAVIQQDGGLAELSVLFSDAGAGNMDQRAQLADTLFSSSAFELDELTSRKFQLDAAKEEVDETEVAAAEARKVTTEQLESFKQAEEAAKTKRTEVVEKVAQHDVAKVKADSRLAAEKGRQSESKSESSEVGRRIQERIAQQKRAEEERQARERSSQQSGSSSSGSSSGSGFSSDSNKSSSPSGGFIHLVGDAVSPPCGMRVHPVLGYSKLHDDTDFMAGCGTPIHVAGDGMASKCYFNAGHGDRLMIDHGSKGGTYVITGYSHATSYAVSVGDHVSQGQVVGYVGTTGYLAGCHLHLMVWEDGSVTNPMSHWFS